MQITLTTAGLAAANNAAQAGLQLAISEIAVGTAYYSPSAAAAALQAEVARFPVAGGTDSGNVIRLTALVDGNGAFPIGEIGFFTAEGLLFALYSNPAAPFAHKSAAGSVALEFDLVLSAVPAGSVTLTPSGSLNLDLSEELAGLALAHIDGMSRDLRNRLERPGGIIEVTILAHEAAPDPHPQYMTQDEGDVRYAAAETAHAKNTDTALDSGSPNEVTSADLRAHLDSTGNPHSVTAAQAGADPAGTAAALIAAHSAWHQAFTQATFTAAIGTIDISVGEQFDITLATAAPSIDLINPPGTGMARQVAIRIRQDSNGSRSIGGWKVAGNAITPKYPGGTAPTLTSTARAVDDLHLQLVNIQGSYVAYINVTGKDWK